MIECAMQSLDLSLLGREDEISLELIRAVQEQRERIEKQGDEGQ
jgi:hypothetical protein